MFWNKDKKKDKPQTPAKPSREQLIAQAKANAAQARADLGEDTIRKMNEAIQKNESAIVNQIKQKIGAMDDGKVADNVKLWLDEKKKR